MKFRVEWRMSYLVVDRDGGSYGCLLLNVGGDQGTGNLEASDGLRSGASWDGVDVAGLTSTAGNENIPATLPADEDAAARIVSAALKALFLTCGQIAATRSGEDSGEEVHKSEREDEELHGVVCVGFVRFAEEWMIDRQVEDEGKVIDRKICVYIDVGEGSVRGGGDRHRG
jgi:hypothetical protein